MNETNELKTKLQGILDRVVPHAHTVIRERSTFYGSEYFAIHISASNVEINRVKGQWPAHVSLSLDPKTMELEPQVFGGMGGQSFYRLPRKSDPKEKYLALAAVRIPFRKPKRNEKAVLGAVERFADRWKSLLGEVIDEMPPREGTDYSAAIK